MFLPLLYRHVLRRGGSVWAAGGGPSLPGRDASAGRKCYARGPRFGVNSNSSFWGRFIGRASQLIVVTLILREVWTPGMGAFPVFVEGMGGLSRIFGVLIYMYFCNDRS